MANIIVLGAGLVGGVMAKDLAKNHNVTSVDISQKNLDKLVGINTICADVSDTATLQNLIKDFDLVVGGVPGFMGFKMMKDVIEAGKNIVDISFYPEDPFGLDELAKGNGVVAVMDCGVAPGMGNIIFGHHNSKMEINDYECLVGGLPEKREWPVRYANTPKPPATKTLGRIANPSKPSVKFTALLLPVITNQASTTNPKPSSNATSLKTGTSNEVSAGDSAVK